MAPNDVPQPGMAETLLNATARAQM